MKTLTLLLLLLLSTTLSFSQINDIFIGNFYTFDPYLLSPNELEENIPGFDKNQLFVWLYQRVPEDNTIEKLDSATIVFNGLSPSEFYTTKDPLIYENDTLEIGKNLFFGYKNTVFETSIERFIYYFCYNDSCNIYAACSIPLSLGNVEESPFFYDIVCSTSKDLHLSHDRFNEQKIVEDTIRIGDYTITSYLEDTGLKGKYMETVYESFIQVRYKSDLVYDTKRQYYQLFYKVGDFNGNGKLDLFIFHHPWDRIYWIIEFKGAKFQIKGYKIESMS